MARTEGYYDMHQGTPPNPTLDPETHEAHQEVNGQMHKDKPKHPGKIATLAAGGLLVSGSMAGPLLDQHDQNETQTNSQTPEPGAASHSFASEQPLAPYAEIFTSKAHAASAASATSTSIPPLPSAQPDQAQNPPGGPDEVVSQFFPETKHTVDKPFIEYWYTHGGLAQQGFPISDEKKLKSTDDKEYKTQYFQRAVFEQHPEYAGTPNEVLLKLVGKTFYDRNFKDGPPQGQKANPENNVVFKETNHSIGGKFRNYWEKHGGLAQQGFPITEEFKYKSTDGKEYTTQIFQRAVMEQHPEFAETENEVLLRLLGVEEMEALNAPQATPTAETPKTPTPKPVEATPTVEANRAEVSINLPNNHGSVQIFGGENFDFQAVNPDILSQMFEKIYEGKGKSGKIDFKLQWMTNGDDLLKASHNADPTYKGHKVNSTGIPGPGYLVQLFFTDDGMMQIPLINDSGENNIGNIDKLYQRTEFNSAERFVNAQMLLRFLTIYSGGENNIVDLKNMLGPELSTLVFATQENGKYVYRDSVLKTIKK